jgi:hypothetical protein
VEKKVREFGVALFSSKRENVVPAKAGTQVRRLHLTRRRGMSDVVYAPAITGSTNERKGP